MSRLRLAISLTVLCGALLLPGSAHATFPGKNGKLAGMYRCCPSTDPDFNNWYTSLLTVNPDGSARAEPAGPGTGRGLWSPDGRTLAFLDGILTACSGCHPLYSLDTINADATERTFVTDDLGAGSFKWNPDGSGFFFLTAGKYVVPHLFRIDKDGTGERQLTEGPTTRDPEPASPYDEDLSFDPSPAGGKVAVVRQRSDLSDKDLWIVDASEGSAVQISHDGGAKDNPVWSPDGRAIAYTGSAGCCPDETQVFDVRPDGTGRTQLTHFASPSYLSRLSWSPDGEHLVFVRESDGILTVSADSGAVQELGTGLDPVWSPDATRIAFTVNTAGSLSLGNIYTMNAEGTHIRQVTSTLNRTSPTDWQALPVPRRSDYTSSAKFCRAAQAYWGDGFAALYGGSSNAYGKCVSRSH